MNETYNSGNIAFNTTIGHQHANRNWNFDPFSMRPRLSRGPGVCFPHTISQSSGFLQGVIQKQLGQDMEGRL